MWARHFWVVLGRYSKRGVFSENRNVKKYIFKKCGQCAACGR